MLKFIATCFTLPWLTHTQQLDKHQKMLALVQQQAHACKITFAKVNSEASTFTLQLDAGNNPKSIAMFRQALKPYFKVSTKSSTMTLEPRL